MFPRDMGFSTEENGPRLRFLVAWVSVHGSNFTIQPWQPNIEYIRKNTKVLRVSRCPWYINCFQTPLHMLRTFIFAQVFSYNHVCSWEPCLAFKHVAILCLECSKAWWKPRQIAKCLLSRTLRFRSNFLDICVRIGVQIYKRNATKWLTLYAHMPLTEITRGS